MAGHQSGTEFEFLNFIIRKERFDDPIPIES